MLVSVKQAMAALPVPVSPRSFRLAARRSGKNVLTGRQMMIELDDITTILKELEKWQTISRNKRKAAARKS